MSDNLMSREEVAELLDVGVESVRTVLARHGINEQRGYDRRVVLAFKAERDRRATGERGKPQ